MAQGSWTGTAASVAVLAADPNREHVHLTSTHANDVAIGIGEAAVAGEGMLLQFIGDSIHIKGAGARKAIYILGNSGTGSYMTGYDCDVARGPA